MAQGKKYPQEIKEKALALLAVNTNVSAVARELGLPRSTIVTWQQEAENDEDFGKLRQQKKEEFISGAWDIVMRAQRLINRRLDRAEKEEAELDRLLDEVECMSDDELSDAQRRVLVKRITDLKLDDIGKLGTVMGTMFDKHALALNQPTTIHGGEVAVRKFEEL
ncbi:MAG: transposase [Clostridia bacterium]|nr:transposase [Clostridia bacterium]